MLAVFALLMALLAPPAPTIDVLLEPLSATGASDLLFSVHDAPPGDYFAQATATECLGIGPQLFYFDVQSPGDAAGYTVRVSALPCAHATGETVTIQVWDIHGSGAVVIERVIHVPIANPFHHIYVPLIS